MIKLICGRSRAGKTTFCKRYENVIHLDRWGVAPRSYGGCLKAVSEADGDITIDGIFNTAEWRTALLNAYKGGGKRVCVWIDTPLDTIESRFPSRLKPRNLPHPFEPPTLSEGWDEIIRITNYECNRTKRET